jgi:hypothetical protein
VLAPSQYNILACGLLLSKDLRTASDCLGGFLCRLVVLGSVLPYSNPLIHIRLFLPIAVHMQNTGPKANAWVPEEMGNDRSVSEQSG